MVMFRQIFCELESCELVARGDSPDHAGSLEIAQMTVGRASWDVGHSGFDVRQAHRVAL